MDPDFAPPILDMQRLHSRDDLLLLMRTNSEPPPPPPSMPLLLPDCKPPHHPNRHTFATTAETSISSSCSNDSSNDYYNGTVPNFSSSSNSCSMVSLFSGLFADDPPPPPPPAAAADDDSDYKSFSHFLANYSGLISPGAPVSLQFDDAATGTKSMASSKIHRFPRPSVRPNNVSAAGLMNPSAVLFCGGYGGSGSSGGDVLQQLPFPIANATAAATYSNIDSDSDPSIDIRRGDVPDASAVADCGHGGNGGAVVSTNDGRHGAFDFCRQPSFDFPKKMPEMDHVQQESKLNMEDTEGILQMRAMNYSNCHSSQLSTMPNINSDSRIVELDRDQRILQNSKGKSSADVSEPEKTAKKCNYNGESGLGFGAAGAIKKNQSESNNNYGYNYHINHPNGYSSSGDGQAATAIATGAQKKNSSVQGGSSNVTANAAVNINVQKPSEDGYNWRKYGQKQVKGCEFPRSYYKCTFVNCHVTKKVERSYDGQVTEIVYKGEHNHPKPNNISKTPSRSVGNHLKSAAAAAVDHHMIRCPVDDDVANINTAAAPHSDVEDDSTEDVLYGDDLDDAAVDAKRRKVVAEEEDGGGGAAVDVEGGSGDMFAPLRTVREPRVVVQTTSDVDILDDGYRWRKYGQKVVKGNAHPRSYYKCTNAGCSVRKQVERSSKEPTAVITTYEGKHNHDVPTANRNHTTSNIIHNVGGNGLGSSIFGNGNNDINTTGLDPHITSTISTVQDQFLLGAMHDQMGTW